MPMPSLLLILSRFPYPPIGGDKLKSYHLINILYKHFSLHLVCITNQPLQPEQEIFCKKYFATYKVFFKPRYKHLLGVFKNLLSPMPLQVHYYFFNDVAQEIEDKAKQCNIIINTLVRTSPYVLNLRTRAIKVLDIVDSIYLHYLRSKHKTKSLIYQVLYTLETRRLQKYEQLCVSNYDLSLFVNHAEASHYKLYGAVACLPNGVDSRLFDVAANPSLQYKYKHTLAFCGKMNYRPNIDAILWFIQNVLPLLRNKISILIIGANPTKELLKIQASFPNRIEITGFLEDVHTPIASCMASIAPMQTGGGIQNKILEAMALGQIVFTTTLGASPISQAKHNKHLLVFDEPQAMAEGINNLFDNANLYSHIKQNAKDLIKRHYTWDHYETSLLQSINKLLITKYASNDILIGGGALESSAIVVFVPSRLIDYTCDVKQPKSTYSTSSIALAQGRFYAA